jgi:hypothetical protein
MCGVENELCFPVNHYISKIISLKYYVLPDIYRAEEVRKKIEALISYCHDCGGEHPICARQGLVIRERSGGPSISSFCCQSGHAKKRIDEKSKDASMKFNFNQTELKLNCLSMTSLKLKEIPG